MFDEIVGNLRAKETLASLIRQGRVPHALGLEGARGSGKRSLARIVAQAAVCTAPTENRPCGVCSHCKKAAANIHPDIITVAEKGIKAMRELKAEAQLRPNEAAVKLFILEDAHQLTAAAQNSLLKVIEEPPANVCFILTYTGRNALLPTILSRIVTVGIEEPTIEQCEEYLMKINPQAENEKCRGAAQLADGNIGLAQELLNDEKAMHKAQSPAKIADLLAKGDSYCALVMLGSYEKNRDEYLNLLSFMGHYVKLQASAPFRGNNGSMSALQAVVLADIIEDAKIYATQNVGLNLVSAQLCAAAIQKM